MNYELAKELKDAGFPQNVKGQYQWTNKDPERPVVPTLDELIEACGENFVGLDRIDDASYTDGRKMFWAVGVDHQRGGVTPIEAMAYLWIALNKK